MRAKAQATIMRIIDIFDRIDPRLSQSTPICNIESC